MCDPATTGIVIVDHGSRRAESNDMLLKVVEVFLANTDWPIVEPAHMELAEPSIEMAFDRCVSRGARRVLVCPYFLLPGKHWDKDIPALTKAAAEKHPAVSYVVTAPIGLHPMMREVIRGRLDRCVARLSGTAEECESCAGLGRCVLKTAEADPTEPAS
jgi:sirohydrochlorin ferrochelatase